ncbi:conserved hypothetical protein [uncultured Dysgonomonas sp.]|uniref:DUF3945 domain-containing protein n=1 Tax=uncultured Dysgonomonas sp. TaxID=206096 RepID=A0A212KFG9_9BACT|nr:DUF3945 domain-containing protein [uncultured Dysgonomonas sp.]SBW10480.1 conserved hypothetical protein [uncultured Dysgonomonas sp.]
MNEKLKDQDVLLVTEKDGVTPKAVSGLNEDGTPKTVEPKKENEPDFLKIDRHGDALENFMSNFLRQCKEPTHFHFFRVPLEGIENIANVLGAMLKDPENPSNKEFMDEIRVLPEAFSKKPYQAIDESRIDWSRFEKLGITKDMIDPKSLDSMLNWQKTPALLPIKAEIGDTTIRTDARLSLRENEDGKLNLVVHAVRKEPQLDGFVYGARLTEEDKQNLRQTGHAGRLVEIEPVKDQKMMAFLSVDKLTNELVAVRADKIKIPDEIKGVTLDEQQKKDLSEGKAVYLEGMTSKSGKDFNATVQINADRRSLEFKFDNTNKLDKSQSQSRQQDQSGGTQFRIPAKLLGAELSEQQQKELKENKTVYVTGMTDKAGEKFNAYIKVNTEKEKFDFFKWNPDKAKKQGAEVTPDNASKTQVAVNSEGKTNEATKNTQEPLKQGQAHPTEKQQEQQEKKEIKKSKGMKM